MIFKAGVSKIHMLSTLPAPTFGLFFGGGGEEVAYFNWRMITLQYYEGFATYPTLALKELIKI